MIKKMKDKDKLKAFRTEAKLNQERAAKALGFSNVRSIQYVESGEHPLSGIISRSMDMCRDGIHYRAAVVEALTNPINKDLDVQFGYDGNPYGQMGDPILVSCTYDHPEHGVQHGNHMLQWDDIEKMRTELLNIAHSVRKGPENISE